MPTIKYKLEDFHRNVSDIELLDDIKRVANILEKSAVSSREYQANGGIFSSTTIIARFSGWNCALEKAELQLVNQRNVSDKELFGNLENVWANIGRQPKYRDLKSTVTKYSAYQYTARFQTWRNALHAFTEYINSDTGIEAENLEEAIAEPVFSTQRTYKHKTKRFPSASLKVKVLMRDGNICRLCGITVIGSDIHFDHIVPWSKDGETVLENLQILCAHHNIAKGNLDYPENQEENNGE